MCSTLKKAVSMSAIMDIIIIKKYIVTFFLFIKLTHAEASDMFPMDPNIIELTPINFEQQVLLDTDLWIVEFYAPWCGYCKNLVPVLKKTASALKGIMKVGVLNADKYVIIGDKYGVTSYPSIKIFGYYKSHPEDYNEQRTFNSFANAAINAVKRKVYAQFEEYQFISSAGSDIILLDDFQFESVVVDSKKVWLVMFYAPWSNHSKAFLPHWRKAASQLSGAAHFGIFDASRHGSRSQEYQIIGYPTIRAFAPQRNIQSDIYSGPRNANSVVKWILKILQHSEAMEGTEKVQTTIGLQHREETHKRDVTGFHQENHDDEL